jgi:hypothetical protein
MALIRSFPPGAVQTSSGLVRGTAGGGFEDVAAAGSSIVSTTQAGSWSVRNTVSTTQAAAFSVRNLAATTQPAAWSVRNAVATDQSGAWSVYNLASQTQAGAWTVRNLVATTQDGAWSVEQETARFGRPLSDISQGAWTASTGSDLFAMLDEETPVDADYIQTTSASTCEIGLSNATDPGTSSGQVLRYRAKSDDASTLIAKLMEGATTIASRTHTNVPNTWTEYTMTLTGGECDAITDYADLRVKLEAA